MTLAEPSHHTTAASYLSLPHTTLPPGTKVEERGRRRGCSAEVKRRARRIETIRMLKKTGCEPHLANILPFCYILKSRVAGTRALEQCIPSCAPATTTLLPSIKTIRTNLTSIQPNRFNQIIQSMISQRSKILNPTDLIQHFCIAVTVRIRVFTQHIDIIVAFPFTDNTACDQIKF